LAKNVFSECSNFQSIEIGKSIQTLPDQCFKNCPYLSSSLFHGDAELNGKECFSGCSNFQSIEFGKSIQTLPDQCFYHCTSLHSTLFHEQIESISKECFSEFSNLQSIQIGKSIQTLPDTDLICEIMPFSEEFETNTHMLAKK
jgi:hypothetical protein